MQSEKKDLDMQVKLLRQFSVRLADVAYQLHLKPNHITLFRFFIFGIGAAICLFFGGYLLNILALLLIFLSFLGDLVDGDLARRHDLKTSLGAALEENLDSVLLSILVLAISLNLYSHHNPNAVAGFFCLFAQTFSKYYTSVFKQRFQIDCVESHPLLERYRSKKETDNYTKFHGELLAPKNPVLSLFSNFRYYLVIGVLTNHLPESFSVYTAMLNLRWVMLLFLTVSYSRPNHKPRKIFEILASLDTDKTASSHNDSVNQS
jgi:phosphatidylglycerophosphate synthase